MTSKLTLPARLDLTAARPLARDIAQMPGDILLDASAVTHLGGLCLQIILAARQHCKAQSRGFAIAAPSAEFAAALSIFGIAQAEISAQEAA
ncbi:chemotaxis protein CheX [Paracoccus isoporae]|uniref:Chemotaxis protein CheX n=1 Tax=Paracoccus isoporae TaxID=591205 RepID=A0A1G6WCG3_9RHOB|nr:STAS domain-containing protein [Paracoccus isoporae]SDD63640.1 chemotaxis protein CheX [Paracoccus isoporae]